MVFLENPERYWLTKPHTLILLFFFGCALLLDVSNRDEGNSETNVKMGLIAVCVAFLFYSLLQLPDGVFIRPDPAFWRVVEGLGVLYLLFLVFLLFQNDRDSRHLFSYVDPALGKPLPERSYAEDCRLYTPESNISSMENLYKTWNDEFVPAHLIGWFMKTLIFRDVYLCWFLSIFFEILEYSLAHVLPNFAECWWDHVCQFWIVLFLVQSTKTTPSGYLT
eukprot:TRINITY_DN6576_c0_g1_i20.p1 TRINITY_DN6576_c0_g1~~TRINITY_DN6576_c0_g1_i20.p1  ORF type:complete len:221 (+),score=17.37 TRINITY_DN6576_c0_g1_i20:178-840(+)